jgi:hypothetical protein
MEISCYIYYINIYYYYYYYSTPPTLQLRLFGTTPALN